MDTPPFIKIIKVGDLEVRLFGNGNTQIKADHGAIVNVSYCQLTEIIDRLEAHWDDHIDARKPDHLRLDLDDEQTD
jgi:hypothetical protein